MFPILWTARYVFFTFNDFLLLTANLAHNFRAIRAYSPDDISDDVSTIFVVLFTVADLVFSQQFMFFCSQPMIWITLLKVIEDESSDWCLHKRASRPFAAHWPLVARNLGLGWVFSVFFHLVCFGGLGPLCGGLSDFPALPAPCIHSVIPSPPPVSCILLFIRCFPLVMVIFSIRPPTCLFFHPLILSVFLIHCGYVLPSHPFAHPFIPWFILCSSFIVVLFSPVLPCPILCTLASFSCWIGKELGGFSARNIPNPPLLLPQCHFTLPGGRQSGMGGSWGARGDQGHWGLVQRISICYDHGGFLFM